MAVQDAQAGFGYLHGIAGAITFTGTEGTPADLMGAGAKVNLSSINLTHNWTDEEIASQDGTIIEAVVASKEYKDIRFEFMPRAQLGRMLKRSWTHLPRWLRTRL
jgi:hypothetical protein